MSEGLAPVLREIARTIRRFVVLDDHQLTAIALFVAHTYVFEAAVTTPYLRIVSAARESGKTRLLEVLQWLVARPWFTGRVSPAVLVRKVEAEVPTLLLDETDAAFNSGEEYAEALRGVLNSGYRRGGKVSLCVGQGASISYKDFSTFCPKVLAGLKRLPDTVEDRSVVIRFKRRKRDGTEQIERFRTRKAEIEFGDLRVWLTSWARTVIDALRDVESEVPEQLGDRAGECWESLLAIADLACGDWPEKARRAAVALSAKTVAEESDWGLRLLGDIKAVLEEQGQVEISSADLATALRENEESPWADMGRGKGLTPNALARLLAPFGIRPELMRTGSKVFRGYHREQFEDAFVRYMPPQPLQVLQPAPNAGVDANSEVLHQPPVTVTKNGETPHSAQVVTDVTVATPYREGEDQLEYARQWNQRVRSEPM